MVTIIGIIILAVLGYALLAERRDKAKQEKKKQELLKKAEDRKAEELREAYKAKSAQGINRPPVEIKTEIYDGPVYASMEKEKARLAPPPKGAAEKKEAVQPQPKQTVSAKKETYDGPVYADMEKEKAHPTEPPKREERKLYIRGVGAVPLNNDHTFEWCGITFKWHNDRSYTFPYGASVGVLFGELRIDDYENSNFENDIFYYIFDVNGVVTDIGWYDSGYYYHHQFPEEEQKHQETAELSGRKNGFLDKEFPDND